MRVHGPAAVGVVLALAGAAAPCVAAASTWTAPPVQSPRGQDATFTARGHEPGWQIRLSDGQVTLVTDYGSTTLRMHVGAPEPIAGGRRYAGRADGRVLVVTLRDRVCTDAATGLPHPLTVDVTLDEQRLRGCGGDPASLLRGEWRVEELGGIAVTAAPRITLVFGAQGRVSGEASCNRYTGTIEVTGEGIVFGQLVATRRACAAAAMDQERSFLEVLGRVRMFELPGDGTLVLHAMDGRTVRARR